MKTKYTRIWNVDGTLVVAYSIEEAIALYRKSYKNDHDYNDVDIDSIDVIKTPGGSQLAILSVDEEEDGKDERGRVTG